AAAALAFRRQAASILHGPAAAAQVRPSAADGDAVRVDELTAHTRQSFDDSGSLVSIAESTLHGVHLLGGTISIRSIATTSVARVDPRLPGPVNAVATAVQLGQAGTLVSAAAGAVGVAGAVGAPPTVSGADETAATPLGSPASSASVAGLSQQPTASARRSAGTQPRGAARLSGKLAATTDGGLLGRVKTLYLVMTLTCLALALGT